MWMRSEVPFAVVGSNTVMEDEEGRSVRGREYPWGTVNIEDQDHCDFVALRTLLLATHMQDLREVTHSHHYQHFRGEKLSKMVETWEGRGQPGYRTRGGRRRKHIQE